MVADVQVLGDATDGVITLHNNGLTIDQNSITIVDQDTDEAYAVTGLTYAGSPRYMSSISYDAPATDHTVAISLSYTGPMINYESGLYRDAYEDLSSGETRYLAATQFETNGARRAFPCFDEPDLKATFSVRYLLIRFAFFYEP